MTLTVAPPETYSTAEVLAFSGVTHRRLDYWCRVGVFDPIAAFVAMPGSGNARRWSIEHVQAMTVCGRLAETFTEDTTWPRNVPTVVLAHVVACLARHQFPTDGVLMVNGEDATWADDPYEILGVLLTGPPLLVLPLLTTDRPAVA